jgi:hypothetical protein
MSVKRFYPWESEMFEGEHGEYVRHEDYAALEAKLIAKDILYDSVMATNTRLQAELSSLRNTMRTVSDCGACPVCAELAESSLKPE